MAQAGLWRTDSTLPQDTMRDRLRAADCPIDMIDQIGGWKSVNSVGAGYGQGYRLEQRKQWLEKVSLNIKRIVEGP